jgi:hypothetical protein
MPFFRHMIKSIVRGMAMLIRAVLGKRAKGITSEFKEHRRTTRLKSQVLNIELVPSSNTAWLNAAEARSLVQFLSQSGFQHAGVFTVKGNDKVVLAGFAAPEAGVLATVPKTVGSAFVSFESHYTDGTMFECSNMQVPFEPPVPNWLLRQRHLGSSPQELWSLFTAGRPVKALIPAVTESFAKSNTENYFKYEAWMAERGGATREELAARYKAAGKFPNGEDGENFLAMARHDEIERSLCTWWRLQRDVPAPLEEVLHSRA